MFVKQPIFVERTWADLFDFRHVELECEIKRYREAESWQAGTSVPTLEMEVQGRICGQKLPGFKLLSPRVPELCQNSWLSSASEQFGKYVKFGLKCRFDLLFKYCKPIKKICLEMITITYCNRHSHQSLLVLDVQSKWHRNILCFRLQLCLSCNRTKSGIAIKVQFF